MDWRSEKNDASIIRNDDVFEDQHEVVGRQTCLQDKTWPSPQRITRSRRGGSRPGRISSTPRIPEAENYVPIFFHVYEDHLEFKDDENIANMLGPLNLLEELLDNFAFV